VENDPLIKTRILNCTYLPTDYVYWSATKVPTTNGKWFRVGGVTDPSIPQDYISSGASCWPRANNYFHSGARCSYFKINIPLVKMLWTWEVLERQQALRNTRGKMFPLSLKTAIPNDAYLPLTVFSAAIFGPFVTTNKDHCAATQQYVILALVRITR